MQDVFLAEIHDSSWGATSGWQLLFVSFGLLLILLETLRGWRLGLARQIMRAVAIAAAYVCMIFAGSTLLPVTRLLLRLPDPVLAWVGGALLALMLYLAITGLGAFFFRRTAQQNSAALRLFSGMGGAVFGAAFGVFFVGVLFVGIRLVGSVAEAQVRTQAALDQLATQPLRLHNGRAVPASPPTPLVTTLAQIKSSLEQGPLGARLAQADPVPGKTYTSLQKLGEVSSNPAAAQRFLAFPGAREISDHPIVMALRHDPEVQSLITRGDVLGLMQNPRVIAAIDDPQVRERIRRFELDRALTYALEDGSNAGTNAAARIEEK